jgi:hypothetical protein
MIRSVGSMCLIAVFVLSAAAKAGEVSKGSPDVDDLVRLLSQDVIIGATAYRRPTGAEWFSAVRKLRGSSDPAVAATVKAMTAPEGPLTGRAFALTLSMKVRAESHEKMQKLVESGHGNPTGIFDKWADDDQLNDAVKSGAMTRSEADAYAAARDGAHADTNATWSTILSNAVQEKVVEDQARAINKRAEVMEGYVFAEHLVAPMRARAGAKTDVSPLDLKIGILPDRSNNYEELGLVCGSSAAAREMTRLTLLLTVRGAVGSRYVAAFMPRLSPGETFRLLPFACGTSELRATAFKKPAEESLGHYSIWCDQLSLENQPLPAAATQGGILAYAAQAVLASHALISDPPRGFGAVNPLQARIRLAQQQAPPRPTAAAALQAARVGITFTDTKPTGTGYQVKARFDRYDPADKSKIIGSTPLTGSVHNSPPPKDRSGAVLVPDAICDLQGAGVPLQLQITIAVDGELVLISKGGPFEGRGWDPAEEVKRSDNESANMRKHTALLNKAHVLAKKGQKEEAAKIAKGVLADSPSHGIEVEAKDLLRELDP